MILTPPVASATQNHALPTFNAPNARANVQCLFTVVVAASAVARQDLVTAAAHKPLQNIVVLVPLRSTTQNANVQWSTTIASCMISIFYSFSALLTA